MVSKDGNDQSDHNNDRRDEDAMIDVSYRSSK